jgi:hypothetical protein
VRAAKSMAVILRGFCNMTRLPRFLFGGEPAFGLVVRELRPQTRHKLGNRRLSIKSTALISRYGKFVSARAAVCDHAASKSEAFRPCAFIAVACDLSFTDRSPAQMRRPMRFEISSFANSTLPIHRAALMSKVPAAILCSLRNERDSMSPRAPLAADAILGSA